MLDKILGENPDVVRIQSSVAKTLRGLGLRADAATALAAATGVCAGIAFAREVPGWGIVLLAVSAALERHGPKLIDYPPGILERTEALIFFVVLGAISSIAVLRPAGPILCYTMTALEIATGAQRFLFGWRMLKREQPSPFDSQLAQGRLRIFFPTEVER